MVECCTPFAQRGRERVLITDRPAGLRTKNPNDEVGPCSLENGFGARAMPPEYTGGLGPKGADALKEFEASLKKEPNRFRSVSGAGRAAESAGERSKARLYYDQLVKICERGDRNVRPDLDHARQYTAASRDHDLGVVAR